MKTEKDVKFSKKNIITAVAVACAVICAVSMSVSAVLQFKSYKILAVLNENTTEASSLSLQNKQGTGSFEIITEKSASAESTTAEELHNETTFAQNKTESTKVSQTTEKVSQKTNQIDAVLVVNTNTKKIHSSTCTYAEKMTGSNRKEISSDELQSYLDNGYAICSKCQASR